MSVKTFLFRLLPVGCICVLLLALFHGCAFSGLDSDLPRSLGKFYGRLVGDSLPTYQNPRVAVVWQSVTGDLSFWDGGNATIQKRSAGYAGFVGDFSTLPDTGIANSDEFVVGQLWLYDDVNRNGILDWKRPADYENIRAAIADARQQLRTSMDLLLTYADYVVTPAVNVDSFRVKNGGFLYSERPGQSSTPLNQDASSGSGVPMDWRAVLRARFQILFYPNKWEAFFNPNGSLVSGDFLLKTEGTDTVISTCQQVRYLPRTGKEADFEQALQQATLKQLLVDYLTKKAKNEINQEVQSAGASQFFERLLGRSAGDTLQNYIVYFSSGVSLGAMLEAEKASGYFFALKENLKVGFNLVECDYNQNCRVQAWEADSVTVSVGQHSPAMVFRPPLSSSPVMFANPIEKTGDTTDKDRQKYNGRYLNPFDADSLKFLYASGQGHFGMDFPPYGVLDFYFAGKNGFFHRSSLLSIDLVFIDNSVKADSLIYKVVGVVIDKAKSPPDSVRFYSLNPDNITAQYDLERKIDSVFSGLR